MTQASSAPTSSRRLPVPVQLLLVGAIGLILAILVVGVPALLRASVRSADSGDTYVSPPGMFRATPEQWRTFAFAPVDRMAFATQIITDGKVAVDDDATVQVTPPFSGRVSAVFVKAGDRVVVGQPMLSAQASEVAQARSDQDTAAANLKSAVLQRDVADANAARQQALFKISGAALKDVQQAQGELASADATVKADQAALTLVHDRLLVLDAKGGAGALSSVRAPISGVVTLRAVGPGQYLNATSNGATTVIFAISNLSHVWLTANVRQEDAPLMRVGLPVEVQVAGLAHRIFKARLDYVAAAIDPATRRLTVRAKIANPDAVLKPEMFTQVAITEGPSQPSLAAPSSAVIYEGDKAHVWVAHPDHDLELRQVQTGRTDAGEVEITSGLTASERVVTSGAIFIDRAAKSD